MKFIKPLFIASIVSSLLTTTPLFAESTAANINNQHAHSWVERPLSNELIARLEKQKINRLTMMKDLKAKLSGLNVNPKYKAAAIEKINQYIEHLSTSKSNTSFAVSNPEMNFMDLRIADGLIMLDSIQPAAENTINALQAMRALAIKAANGTFTREELANLNIQFQAYRKVMRYVQTVDLLNGEKVLSGGDVSIRIGSDEKDAASTLTIKVPAFNPETLGINNLSIETASNAALALVSLYEAIQNVEQVLVQVGPVIGDAEGMLAMLPSTFYQDYVVFWQVLELAMQANNGAISELERGDLEVYFDYLKALLVKNQTYISLQGPKMLGGGSVHIQIGQQTTPDNVLDINLPTTDIKKLGLDVQAVHNQASASEAQRFIVQELHDFAYNTETN